MDQPPSLNQPDNNQNVMSEQQLSPNFMGDQPLFGGIGKHNNHRSNLSMPRISFRPILLVLVAGTILLIIGTLGYLYLIGKVTIPFISPKQETTEQVVQPAPNLINSNTIILPEIIIEDKIVKTLLTISPETDSAGILERLKAVNTSRLHKEIDALIIN